MHNPTRNHDNISTQIWTAEQAYAIDEACVSGDFSRQLALMEEAGRAVAEQIMRRWLPQEVVVIAGPGNNGGDAMVVARHLAKHDYNVSLFYVTPENAQKETKANLFQVDKLKASEITFITYKPGCLFNGKISDKTLVVDGILGLGVKASLRKGVVCDAVKELARLAPVIVSIDVPSGFSADGCQDLGELIALQATLTVSFGAKKPVHCLAPTKSLCGTVVVADIFDRDTCQQVLKRHPIELAEYTPQGPTISKLWSQLSPHSHKYDRGHVLVWGGSKGKTGAAILAGLAALRSGAGWVSVAVSEQDFVEATARLPYELTAEAVPLADDKKAEWLKNYLRQRKVKAVVVGPGWVYQQLTKTTLQVLKGFVADGGALVIDAGALIDLLSLKPKFSKGAQRVLLTPHPGEWSRLALSEHATHLEGITEARKKLQDIGAAVVYKGATPVVFSSEMVRPLLILPTGSNVLARAGCGDVLAGTSAALLLRCGDAGMAFCYSYEVISKAAADIAKERGGHSVLAHDIIGVLGRYLEQ